MEIKFYPTRNPDGKILAFAAVEVAEGVVVRGFRIVDGDRGLFAAVPSNSCTVDGRTRYYDQVLFSDVERKERLLAEVLDEYHRWIKSSEAYDRAEKGGGPVDEHSRERTAPF